MSIAIATTVSIRVGSESVAREDFTVHWLTDQLRRQATRCVRVEIDHPDANLLLSSCGCPAGHAGGGRAANRKELAIFDLWEERGMKDPNWAPGNLNAFLQQLRRLL